MQLSSFPLSVYIAADGHGLHKIGVTGDPPTRLYHLRRDTKRPVEFIRVNKPTREAELIEAAAHWQLSKRHVHGEWFAASQAEAIAAVEVAAEQIARGEYPERRFIRGGRAVHFSEPVLARIETLVGSGLRTKFIREAVERELARREREAKRKPS